jgi:peroxiredoxin
MGGAAAIHDAIFFNWRTEMTVHIPGIDADIGKVAPEFSLPATDEKTYRLSDVMGTKGTVVVFICNHCPYVKGVADRMVADAKALAKEGIGFVAISSNDVEEFPEDSFPLMKDFAAKHGFPFPYLFDASQEVARAYGAVCTPDFFGLNADGVIAYRGRLDEGKKDPPPPGVKRELFEAMRQVASTGKGPDEQIASVGCSIKWKDN